MGGDAEPPEGPVSFEPLADEASGLLLFDLKPPGNDDIPTVLFSIIGLMDGGAVHVDGVDSINGGMEALWAQPKPCEQDQAGVHVPLGLVAFVASEHRVLCAARPSA